MPRTPITSREAFYKKLSDGTIVFHDWCLVDTSLGAMLEPRSHGVPAPFVTIDAKDMGVTRMVEQEIDVIQFQHSTGGVALPMDWSY